MIAAAAATPAVAVQRGPTLEEIVETKSIDSLVVSLDGRHVAFRLISPSVATNFTTVQWHVVPIDGGPVEPWGIESEPSYIPMFDVIEDGAAAWLGDGRSLFVRQQANGEVQIHDIGPDRRDVPITHDEADVIAFTVPPSDDRVDYQVRNTRAEIDRAQADAERTGVHIDGTVGLEGIALTRNFRIGRRETTIRWSGTLATEAFAGDSRARSLPLPAPHRASGRPTVRQKPAYLDLGKTDDRKRALSLPSGLSVSVASIADSGRFLSAPLVQVVATLPGDLKKPCAAWFCRGLTSVVREIVLNQATPEIVVLREDGFSGRSGLYGWNPRTGRSRTIVAPDGSLDGGSAYSGAACPNAGVYLICVQAAPSTPPRLVRIDLRSGATRILAEPNRELATRHFSRSRFITWRDAAGRDANGVLLLPDHADGPLPMVITTYRCRGFLRGGIAWLAAEEILAQRGYAVLCANVNNMILAAPEVLGRKVPLFAHDAVIQSYAAIIDRLAHDGVIDRHRVGVSGHSFSGNAILYGISHGDLFAAAVIGSGNTIDPIAAILTNPVQEAARSSALDFLALPMPTNDPEGRWARVSPSLNAARIHTPLLMQPPGDEYLTDIQLLSTINAAGGTVDMFAYPGAGHLASRQPLHQLWRNRRSLDWFDFWLRGIENRSAETDAQYDYWEKLRRRRIASTAPTR